MFDNSCAALIGSLLRCYVDEKRKMEKVNFFFMSLSSCRYVAIVSLCQDVHTANITT